MTNQTSLRALVVDDEAMMRQGTMRALSKVGFVCEPAANGSEALKCCLSSQYDLVVTDLRMPGANGHALAVELLHLPRRPVVVILTGVIEPRLAKDLLARGVDDIVYKPVDYAVFAANVQELVVNRLAKLRETWDRGAGAQPSHSQSDKCGVELDSRIPDLLRTISKLNAKCPDTPPSFDVFKQASENLFDSNDLAIAMQTHPSIAVEVVRLINNWIYISEPSGKDRIESIGVKNDQRQ